MHILVTSDSALLQALEGQTRLWWKEFFQGFHHVLWEHLQHRYLTTVQPEGNMVNAAQWSTKVIQILF